MLGPKSLPVLKVPTSFRATGLGFTGFEVGCSRSNCDGGCYQQEHVCCNVLPGAILSDPASYLARFIEEHRHRK